MAKKKWERGASRAAKGEGKFIVARVVGTPGNKSVYPVEEYNDRRDADWHLGEIEKFNSPDGYDVRCVLEVGKDVERVTTYRIWVKCPGCGAEIGTTEEIKPGEFCSECHKNGTAKK